MFVVMSLVVDYYKECNCPCFETDEVFGPFPTGKDAESFGRKHFGRFGNYRVRKVNEPMA